MSVSRCFFAASILAIFLIAGSPVTGPAQSVGPAPQLPAKPAELVDQLSAKMNAEVRSARFDMFFQQINGHPDSLGYVILYCGRQCKYGEIEAHLRGIEIAAALRGFDRARLITLHAGYREQFGIDLWLVFKGGGAPKIAPTVSIREVVFSSPGPKKIDAYNCCDDITEIWKSILPEKKLSPAKKKRRSKH